MNYESVYFYLAGKCRNDELFVMMHILSGSSPGWFQIATPASSSPLLLISKEVRLYWSKLVGVPHWSTSDLIWIIKLKLQVTPWDFHFFSLLHFHICLAFRAGTLVNMVLQEKLSPPPPSGTPPVFMYSSSTCFYLVCISGPLQNQSVWKKIIWCLPCLAPFMVMRHGGSPSKGDHVAGFHR